MVLSRSHVLRHDHWYSSLLQQNKVTLNTSNRKKLFDNICYGKLNIPYGVSPNAIDLIVKLLDRNPKKRLGAGPGDAEELKTHPFFATINWEDVLQKKLDMPKPLIKPIVEVQMMFKAGQDVGDEKYKRMGNWSFIDNEFI